MLRPQLLMARACAAGLMLVMALVTPGFANTLASIEIQAVDLRETATGAELTVSGNGPLVWTQYRNDAGDLVVELPNTVLAGEVIPPAPRGVVSSVLLEPEVSGTRPMTRMVVSTNTETEHTLFGNDGLLTLTFGVASALGGGSGSIAEPAVYRPAMEPVITEPASNRSMLPASATTVPAVAVRTPTPVSATPMGASGSPEEPIAGPTPQGVRASRLLGVVVVDLDGKVALRIEGDGEFLYSTFRLENPPRFVIDLEGVVNSARESRVLVGRGQIDQVRLAQFRPYPTPVSRVVLDLVGDAEPVLEGTADGLWVRFADPGEEMITEDTTQGATAEPAMEVAQNGNESPTAASVADTVELGSEQTAPALEDAAETTVAESSAQFDTEEAPALAIEEPTLEPQFADSDFSEADTAIADTVVADPSTPEFAEEDPFADDPFADDPLEITDETRVEAPAIPMNDVSLFEAQEVSIVAPDARRNEAPQGFAVQRLDTTTRWVGEPITLTVKDADLSEVLRTIARYAELNLVVQPGISAPVTVEFIAVPWDQALDSILKINRLDKQLEGNILRVAQKDLFRQEAVEDQELAQARALSVPLSTVIKRLSYADAQQVSQILTRGQRSQGGAGRGSGLSSQETGILSRRGSVNVDRRTNTLIIKELPSYLDTVIQVIENLDIPEKQVMIEARIVETTRNFSRSLGIDWSFGGGATAATGNTTGLQFPNRVEAGGGVQLLTGGDNGFFNLSLGNVLNTLQIDLALQAAENEGLINVIASPKIATLNNNLAEIETGLQLPVQTVVGGGGTTAGGVVNPFGTVSVNFIRASLRLQVTPQVTFEGTILMTVNIEKDEPQFALQVPGAPTAPIATRRASTRVRVADGGTAVIGGIYQVSANESESRVPGLARIPVLGQLFKNRNRTNQNQELLIFITPRVIQQ